MVILFLKTITDMDTYMAEPTVAKAGKAKTLGTRKYYIFLEHLH